MSEDMKDTVREILLKHEAAVQEGNRIASGHEGYDEMSPVVCSACDYLTSFESSALGFLPRVPCSRCVALGTYCVVYKGEIQRQGMYVYDIEAEVQKAQERLAAYSKNSTAIVPLCDCGGPEGHVPGGVCCRR